MMLPVDWEIVGASVCGSSHERTGLPCQDAKEWTTLTGGTLIIAVADGAGSASRADEGAAVAVRNAVTAMVASMDQEEHSSTSDEAWKSLMTEAFRRARSAIEAEAARAEVCERELACTLLLVLARPGLLVAGQIGDGAVVFADKGGNLRAATIPMHGEFVNETTFLISPDALETLQTIVWRGELGQIAVFTDGLQMLALQLPDHRPHTPFFLPLFKLLAPEIGTTQATESLEAFLRSPRLRERTDDDVTLVMAAPTVFLTDALAAPIHE